MLCLIFRIIEIMEELDIVRLRRRDTEMLMWEDDRLSGVQKKLAGIPKLPNNKCFTDLLQSCEDTAYNYRQYARMRWLGVRERNRKKELKLQREEQEWLEFLESCG